MDKFEILTSNFSLNLLCSGAITYEENSKNFAYNLKDYSHNLGHNSFKIVAL